MSKDHKSINKNKNQTNLNDSEIIFSLNLSDNDLIISTLKYEYNSLLNSINNNVQMNDNLNNNRQKIIKLLNNLPIKNSSVNSDNQIKLDLKLSIKNKLIINLMNYYEYLKHIDLVNEHSKINLINESRQLIEQLMNLKTEYLNKITNEEDGDVIFLDRITNSNLLESSNNKIKETKNRNQVNNNKNYNEKQFVCIFKF